MKNLELNKQEEKELERRGFFVKKNFGFKDLYIGIIYIFVYLSLAMIPASIIGGVLAILTEEESIIIFLLLAVVSYPIILFFISFIVSGNIFFTNRKIIQLNEIGKKLIGKKYNNLFLLKGYFSKIVNSGSGGIGFIIYGLLAPFIFGYIIPINTYLGANSISNIWSLLLAIGKIILIQSGIYLIGFFLFVSLIYLLRIIFQKFHSLSLFGNIGIKIQKLTPRIEEQSKQIQSEFQSDMNYSVLSNGFDSLSATFSDIVTLVIKLEKVETRANKGNLFDSEKYINSLRSDIVTPLTSLKIFLEKQKTELMQSQKELTRIRVGGIESGGHTELQSKRSESLTRELTENIEKLDVMTQKMG